MGHPATFQMMGKKAATTDGERANERADERDETAEARCSGRERAKLIIRAVSGREICIISLVAKIILNDDRRRIQNMPGDKLRDVK